MASRYDAWAQMPANWNALAALDDPHAWCSLSAWRPAAELVRGAQVGPREPHRVWCLGLYRYPYQYVECGRFKRPRPASPWLYVLPQALRALCHAVGIVGKPGMAQLCRKLARAGLCAPRAFMQATERHLSTPITLPRACGEYRQVYAFRGEIALLGQLGGGARELDLEELEVRIMAWEHLQQLSGPEWAIARFLAAMARSYLMGWYASNAPARLVVHSEIVPARISAQSQDAEQLAQATLF